MKLAMPMRHAVRTLLALAPALAPGPARAQEPPPVATLVIVRHAETATDGTRDPSLSEAGRARAAALASSLAHADVAAVFTTQYRRTRETGNLVAERTGARFVVVPAQGDIASHAGALLERILAEHAGRTVLVVGHSNTVPAIVRAATGVDVEPIAEDEHGRMYIVRTDGEGGSVVAARIPSAPVAPMPAVAQAAGVPADSAPSRTCVSAAHRAFDFWLGRWTVRTPDDRIAGRSRITRVSDGCAVLEEWSGAG
ncbi:MAG: phosphoglycerate mutase family protein, partial [Longimicrobiales bacterium]